MQQVIEFHIKMEANRLTMSGDFDQRIVRIRNFNVLTNELDEHPLADFSTWRTELESVEQLGAFTRIERNLVNATGQSILFLCACGANVATLVFARTATREGEIAVRAALGASRGRIVAQLFCEGLMGDQNPIGVRFREVRIGMP